MRRAQVSSLCPVCGFYIAKNHSHKPRALRQALIPTNDHGRRSDGRPRKWVHDYCYEDGVRLLAEFNALRRTIMLSAISGARELPHKELVDTGQRVGIAVRDGALTGREAAEAAMASGCDYATFVNAMDIR